MVAVDKLGLTVVADPPQEMPGEIAAENVQVEPAGDQHRQDGQPEGIAAVVSEDPDEVGIGAVVIGVTVGPEAPASEEIPAKILFSVMGVAENNLVGKLINGIREGGAQAAAVVKTGIE